MFGNWGRAIISLDAGEEPEPADVPRFNRNVLVENNEFRLVDSRIVSAVSVDGFVFRNNKIIRSDGLPVLLTTGRTFHYGTVCSCRH